MVSPFLAQQLLYQDQNSIHDPWEETMKILLVMPATQQQRVTKDNPQPLQRSMLRFSVLPLTTVAALTPAEHQVSICDENVQPLDFDVDVDLVSVSFMTAYALRSLSGYP